MENLWKMIAEVRGVELDEEFIWDYKGFKYKHRITTSGLQIFVEDKWFGNSTSATAFIEGAGEIEKLPFRPQIGDTFYTIFSNTMVTSERWAGSAGDYARLMAGLVFRTKEEAAAYIPTWKEIVSKL